MAEYIEREATKKELAGSDLIPKYEENNRPITDRIIDRIPAADVAPVRHAKWIDNGIPDSMLSGCSVCGFSCGAYSFNYCPNCGALMDGGTDHA